MKKTLIFLVLLNCCSQELMAQRLSPFYVNRELKISPVLHTQLQATRASLKSQNKRFTVGATAVLGRDVLSYTGAIRTTYNKSLSKGVLNANYSITNSTTVNSKTYSMNVENLLPPIRDQKNCGSCWAFAFLGAAESNYFLKYGSATPIDFSEQQIICSANAGNCNGGAASTVAKWAFENKIKFKAEASLPYTSNLPKLGNESESCPKNLEAVFSGEYVKVVDYGFVPINDGDKIPSVINIKEAILTHGAVTASFWADSLVFAQHFGPLADGVFEEAETVKPEGYKGKMAGHQINIVGWDDNQGAWIVRNSWGTSWSDDGYGFFKYGAYNFGGDMIWVEVQKFNKNNIQINPNLKNSKIENPRLEPIRINRQLPTQN